MSFLRGQFNWYGWADGCKIKYFNENNISSKCGGREVSTCIDCGFNYLASDGTQFEDGKTPLCEELFEMTLENVQKLLDEQGSGIEVEKVPGKYEFIITNNFIITKPFSRPLPPIMAIKGSLLVNDVSISLNGTETCKSISVGKNADLTMPYLSYIKDEIEVYGGGKLSLPKLISCGCIVMRSNSQLKLPQLRTLNGGLLLFDNSLLSLPDLAYMGGSITMNDKAWIYAPSLKSTGALYISGVATIEAPCLTLCRSILIDDNGSINLPALEIVTSHIIADGKGHVNLNLPQLQTVKDIAISINSSIDLPNLLYIFGDVDIGDGSISASNLRYIYGEWQKVGDR